jgi:uncharacterized protein
MLTETAIEKAIGGHESVPDDWMPATSVRSFVLEDPVIVWLQFHGEEHGFRPDASPYDFLDFISKKGREFEEKWVKETAPKAVRVCEEPFDVRSADKPRETFDLMMRETPVIYQPALWWAPERIYGVPDLLVHTRWLEKEFPNSSSKVGIQEHRARLGNTAETGNYVVFDIKFTTGLDKPRKAKDFENNAAQVKIYSYMLGHLQSYMPSLGYLVTRDRILRPMSVKITSTLDEPLDKDLADFRERFIDIKLNGADYVPWQDRIVASDVCQQNEQWRNAKNTIARERMPGGDPALVAGIGQGAKQELATLGFRSLDSMLQPDPTEIPFERCTGLGTQKAKCIRTILQANRSGSPVLPPASLIPSRKDFEFFVDFEYFTDVNVDFERQWPGLEGCGMIFMVGLGYNDEGQWTFETFIAEAEDQDEENHVLEEFLSTLRTKSGNTFTDRTKTCIYHWTSAEVWQTKHVADRHHLPADHPLRKLPWQDIQKVFRNGPCSVPGEWSFGLKEVAKALGEFNPDFETHWPGDLDAGLRAMVMGWRAYEGPNPLESEEMDTLKLYLEADCKALWNILRWLRSS